MDAKKHPFWVKIGSIACVKQIGKAEHSTHKYAENAQGRALAGEARSPCYPPGKQKQVDQEVGITLRAPVKLQQVAKINQRASGFRFWFPGMYKGRGSASKMGLLI